MDSQRFDAITRAFATGTSRRAVLRRLGAGLAGFGLVATGRGLAAAAPSACASFCADQPGARGAQCRQTCKACTGGPAATCFNAATGSFTCEDILTDEANCGGCGNVCLTTCRNGTCCIATGQPLPGGCAPGAADLCCSRSCGPRPSEGICA